ncbi:polysaccharide biosynthesis protein [Nocardia sp. NPDC048505]|uniref:polysaccharide biosynthesis protein n=1 Tax=unclassified Nocardia TaxID=2637762 RepID=UPI003407C4CA
MTANVAGYLLQVLASRWLGVAGFSEFASLLAVQLLCAVPALALQNVVARELVRGASVRTLRGLQWRCAVIVAALAALLVPLVTLALDVDVRACAAALGAAPALVLLSGEQGILQGSNRFRQLAVVLGCAGVARVAPALIVLILGGGTAAALLAAALGLAAAAALARRIAGAPDRSATATVNGLPNESAKVEAGSAVPTGSVPAAPQVEHVPVGPEVAAPTGSAAGAAQVGHVPVEPGAEVPSQSATSVPQVGQAPVEPGAAVPSEPVAGVSKGPAGKSLRERTAGVLPVLRAAQVQAALMALSSADLIVVRMVLGDTDDASRYALGTVAAKIAFWLPQAVGVVLYPRMAQPTQSARAIRDALAVLSGIGIVAVLGAAAAAPLAPLFAGSDYAPIQGLLWLFALHGAILAVLQGAVLSAIALDRTALAALAWVGLIVEVTLTLLFAHSITTLITLCVCVAATTTAVVAAIVLRTADRTRAAARPHAAT